jgi:DNA-binding transcriptional MerR regulator
MNTNEVSRLLSVSPKTVQMWCRKGLVPGAPCYLGSAYKRSFDDAQVAAMANLKQIRKEAR